MADKSYHENYQSLISELVIGYQRLSPLNIWLNFLLNLTIQIKSDSVLVMLKKARKDKWEGMTESDRKKKEKQ